MRKYAYRQKHLFLQKLDKNPIPPSKKKQNSMCVFAASASIIKADAFHRP